MEVPDPAQASEPGPNPRESRPLAPIEPPQTLRRALAEVFCVFALALALNLLGNGRVSLWDRDEPRYATCTREMRASGDWVYPTFNGQPRFDKPVLIYWLMMAGTALGGDNPFGARLISSLAGAATCVVVWALGRRMLGRQAGLLGALALASAPIMVVESKLATTDATLALWLVSAQACLWHLNQRESKAAAFGFWTLIALAVLTKGPVGPALVAMAGLASWRWGGPTACWRRLRWRAGLAWFVLLAAPWFLAIGIESRGDFFRVAMGHHVIHRVATGMEQHGAFPGFYVLTSLVTFHPWSALLPAALLGAWSRRRMHPELAFLLGWVVGPLILLECVRTKLVHYYLPAYPACALLAAWLIVVVSREEVNLRRWPLGRLSLGLLAGVGVGMTAAELAAAVVVPSGLRWPLLVLAILTGGSTLYALERFQKAATLRAAGTLVAAWSLALAIAGGWLLPAAEPYRYAQNVAGRLAALSAERHAAPILATFQEPSIIYRLGRPVPTMRGRLDLLARVQQQGTMVSALIPEEVKAFQADPWFTLEVAETLRGFNLNKGHTESLQFALIRRRSSAVADRTQQPLVK